MRARKQKGNVFVGNLPQDFPDERLAEAFDPYGIVLSAVVARDPVTGARLRYGFVDIATEKAVKRAIGELNGTAIDGSKISVQMSERPAKKDGPATPARRPAPGPMRLTAREPSQAAFPAAPPKQPTFQVERRPLPRRLTPS